MTLKQSHRWFQLAKQFIPGGVNSPVRAFGSVGGEPIFFSRAHGAYLTDIDGNAYIDYVGSWGPMIVGHTHPLVVQAIQLQSISSTSLGAPSTLEVEMARQIVRWMPSIEKIRMVNSGTEAVMSALRLARAYTGKNKILKFEGCYHGHADYLLVQAGSGALTTACPNSLGVPQEFAKQTLVAPYNDLAFVEKIAEKHRSELAAIIVEPIVGNMGCVLPERGFLSGLKKICKRTEALLIFDEVMTGFRVSRGGAQELYNIQPDLTTLGKIIGGGLPVGAYGGRSEIMKWVSPEGGVYQAGTLSGNPLAMAAGLATLKLLSSKATYSRLGRITQRLALGLRETAESAGFNIQVPYVGGMLSLFFSARPVRNLHDSQNNDVGLFKQFFHEMLRRGIYLPPSPYEAWFVSLAHGENEIAKTLRAAKDSFLTIRKTI